MRHRCTALDLFTPLRCLRTIFFIHFLVGFVRSLSLMLWHEQSVDELALKEGDELKVIGKSPDEGWVVAENAAGGRGVVPETHIKYA